MHTCPSIILNALNHAREEREEERIKDELVVRKLMYTKNPFPFIVRKTLIRPEELVWYEELRVNKKKRTASFWYVSHALSCTCINGHV